MGADSLDDGALTAVPLVLLLLVELGAVVHEMEPLGVGANVAFMPATAVGAKVPLRTAPVGA
jgi:hypothetical protein